MIYGDWGEGGGRMGGCVSVCERVVSQRGL